MYSILLKGLEWLMNLIFGDMYRDFKRWLSNVFRSYLRRTVNKLSKKKQVGEPNFHFFTIGTLKTQFVRVGRTGRFHFPLERIRVMYEDEMLTLPEELSTLRDTIQEREQKKLAENIEGAKYNTYQDSLKNGYQTNESFNENPYLVLSFKRSDYYGFQATVGHLDKTLPHQNVTLREKYLHTISNYKKPIDYLAQGVGVVLTIITSDDKLIVTRRDDHTGIRPNELDVSVVEAIDPHKDSVNPDYETPVPSVFKTAIRGAEEELRIDDLKEKDIKILGFGVDYEYYQWNILGTATTRYTYNEVIERMSSGTHSEEFKNIEPIDFRTPVVAQKIVSEKMWGTAKVALYWTLVFHKGKLRTNSVIKKLLDQS